MTIKVDVNLDSKKFKKGSKDIQDEAGKISDSLNGIALASGAIFAAFGAGRCAVDDATRGERIAGPGTGDICQG